MSRQNQFPKYQILGVSVDTLTIAQATDYITTRAQKNGAVYITKPYVEFLDLARRDPEVATILNNSELCLPDSVSMQWASAYLYGGPHHWWRALGLAASIVLRPNSIARFIPEKFGGANFTWHLLSACAQKQLQVYLVGSPKHSDIDHTAATIKAKLPSLTISGTWHGNLSPSEEKKLLADLSQKQPDVILVGMGFPRQERLMSKLAPQLKRGILIGEGGTFDYVSFGGRLRRAPQWLQRLGLEWLWRLILEPRRLRRQLAIPRFMWAVYRYGRLLEIEK